MDNNYGIWLSWNNQQEGFRLPINPGSIEIGNDGDSSTYDVASLGEINVIKNPKLTTFSFSGLFPAQQYPFLDAPLLPPKYVNGVKRNYYVHYLEKWMESKRPIRFVLVADDHEMNLPVSIESFSWKEIAGSGGDLEYSLTLKRYVFYAARKVNIIQAAADTTIIKDKPERENDRQPPSVYTMVAGDTLWKVAKTQLGNGDRWKEIQALNGIKDAELKRLPIGKVLKLP